VSVLDDIAEVLDDIWQAITGLFSTAPASKAVQPCPLGALSPQQAKAWFDSFKNDKSIPWDYPNDCCYNRAEVMARRLKDAGVAVGKEWNYAVDQVNGPLLRVPTPNDVKGYVEWVYHVAPTVPVRMADGSIKDMVMDPSIADGPLTPEQWRALQNLPGAEHAKTASDVYYRAKNGAADMRQRTEDEIKDIFDQHRLNKAGSRTP
jgi:hypothetical protein